MPIATNGISQPGPLLTVAFSTEGETFHSVNSPIGRSDRGRTYALVSDLEERGQQSCIVCHQGGKDQDFIQPLVINELKLPAGAYSVYVIAWGKREVMMHNGNPKEYLSKMTLTVR